MYPEGQNCTWLRATFIKRGPNEKQPRNKKLGLEHFSLVGSRCTARRRRPFKLLVFNFYVLSIPCDLKLWLLLSIWWINEIQTG